MTVTEYIKKLKEWSKDIGSEDEIQITPSRLLIVYNRELWESHVEFWYKFWNG